jgi:hypothetical protein
MNAEQLAVARFSAMVATHEAGHAVAARKLGLPAGRATIRSGPGTEGGAWWADDRGIRDVKTLLAGRAAVELLFDDYAGPGCTGDESKIARLLVRNGFRDTASVRSALLTDVRTLVDEHRDEIAIVAFWLLVQQSLTADEIDALIESPITDSRSRWSDSTGGLWR